MRFQLPWRILGIYILAMAALVLALGPLSHLYFHQPIIGFQGERAIPVQGNWQGISPGSDLGTVPVAPGDVELPRRALDQLFGGKVFGLETLKGFLRVAVPGLAAVEAGNGSTPLPVEGVSLQQAILRGFEVAGGVELGRPWTLLAAELPAMHLVELSEAGPLVVAIETVLPQWQYEELLAAGSEGVDEPQAPAGSGTDGGGLGQDEPAVLIYHTHGTEAFLGPTAAQAGVNPDVVGFSTDSSRNVIRVGAELGSVLRQAGVPFVHVTELFDFENQLVTRTGAYVRSLNMLENFQDGRPATDVHPSIRLIIDLHRDAVGRHAVIQTVEGQSAARILMVVGTRNNPHWESNHCVAGRIHQLLEERHPGLSRGVMVRHDARFNQHLLPSSLLIEVGSVENTLAEALVSAGVLGDVIKEAFQRGFIPEPGQQASCVS